MRTIIVEDKVITISENTTPEQIIDAIRYDGYSDNCTDIEMDCDSISYFDRVNWDEVYIEIMDMEIINL